MKGFSLEMESANSNQGIHSYNLPITSITTSNVHSIASILLASDLSVKKIDKYYHQIKELNYENEGSFIERI
jgi:hypothetical protein